MFTIFKCFGRSEKREKNFSNLKDAEKYIQEHLLKDIELKVSATYRIYEGADQVAERTQKDAILPSTTSSGSDSESSSQGQDSEQIFSPTPLPTSPRPPGMPQNWKTVKKDDKKEDKKR
jgi:hypothetical protein